MVLFREFHCLMVFVGVIPSHQLLLKFILFLLCPTQHLLPEGEIWVLTVAFRCVLIAALFFLFFLSRRYLRCWFLLCIKEYKIQIDKYFSFLLLTVTHCSAQNNVLSPDLSVKMMYFIQALLRNKTVPGSLIF